MVSNVSRGALLFQLQELGVETVTAMYDGSGDDGQIEEIQFGAIDVPPALVGAVDDLFYELLAELYSGWQDSDGSFGEFRWNIAADSISLVHNVRVPTYETEEREL
jgi:hypothetical protein